MGLAKMVKIWSCDACGHTGTWNDNWLHKLVLHRKPVPHDEHLVVCSRECARTLDARRSGKKHASVPPNAS